MFIKLAVMLASAIYASTAILLQKSGYTTEGLSQAAAAHGSGSTAGGAHSYEETLRALLAQRVEARGQLKAQFDAQRAAGKSLQELRHLVNLPLSSEIRELQRTLAHIERLNFRAFIHAHRAA